jgi:hypothetical protein
MKYENLLSCIRQDVEMGYVETEQYLKELSALRWL